MEDIPINIAGKRGRGYGFWDISAFGMAGVAAITVICYLGGMACKTTEKVKDEVIPVVCGVTGGILGVAGMYLIPEFPAGDVINAAAIGIVSELASTGVHQVIKQVGKK